jgi:hypothetical protein
MKIYIYFLYRREAESVRKSIELVIRARSGRPATSLRRPRYNYNKMGFSDEKKELLYNLMDTYIRNDVLSIQASDRANTAVNQYILASSILIFMHVFPLLILTRTCPSQPFLFIAEHFFICYLQEDIVNHVEYTIGRSRYRFDDFEAYMATSYSVRDRLIESWNDTNTWFKENDPKR